MELLKGNQHVQIRCTGSLAINHVTTACKDSLSQKRILPRYTNRTQSEENLVWKSVPTIQPTYSNAACVCFVRWNGNINWLYVWQLRGAGCITNTGLALLSWQRQHTSVHQHSGFTILGSLCYRILVAPITSDSVEKWHMPRKLKCKNVKICVCPSKVAARSKAWNVFIRSNNEIRQGRRRRNCLP